MMDERDLEIDVAAVGNSKLRREDVEAILAAFAKRRGLAQPRFDANGEIPFTVGGELEVVLTHVAQFPGVLAAVALPRALAARPDVMRALLQANLSWQANGGGTFGRAADAGGFLYCQLMPLHERDERSFERQLLAFAARAEAWLLWIEDELAWDPDPADGADGADQASSPRRAPP